MKTLFIACMLVLTVSQTHAKKNDDTPTGDSASAQFKLVEKRGDISLYERWFMYDSVTIAREIKVVFEVKTTIQSAIELLRDETNADKWNLRTSQFRILNESHDRWINYVRYDLPWPVSDHDCVLKYNLKKTSPSKYMIGFESGTHKQFPQNNEASRLSDIRGTWQMEQRNESIHIEYAVTTVPSTTLPRWITDPIIRNNLLDTITKFSRLLETLDN